MKSNLRIIIYNQTYNELTVISDTKEYTYSGVSPFLYNKLSYYINKGWNGKAWQILKRLELRKF